MLRIRRILVGRDFSEASNVAVKYAAELARIVEAEVHVLYADVLRPAPDAPGYRNPSERHALESRLVEGLKDVTATAVVRRELAPAQAILTYATEAAIDLIILGTHGRRGVARMLLGSTAEEVVRKAGCPVLAVHAGDRGLERVKRILVPVDFSVHARTALAHGKELTTLLNARIELLHVLEDFLHPAFYNTGVMSPYDIDPDIDKKALAELERFYHSTAGRHPTAEYYVRDGSPAKEIAAHVAEHDVDLVVMSSHGLRGLEHEYLIGSVANKLIRIASAPVLTVHASGKALIDGPVTVEEEVYIPD